MQDTIAVVRCDRLLKAIHSNLGRLKTCKMIINIDKSILLLIVGFAIS